MALNRRLNLLSHGTILLSHRDKALGSILSSAQYCILKHLQQWCGNIVIHNLRCGVHDSHIQTSTYGVVEEHGVHSLTQIIIASQRERQVADTTTHSCPLKILTNPLRSTYKIQCIAIVLTHTRCDGEDIGVEDYITCIEAQALG